jgi:hypothetical protein
MMLNYCIESLPEFAKLPPLTADSPKAVSAEVEKIIVRGNLFD